MHLVKIRDLGPIKNCELEVEKFTVLTGPQAEGKSTIAKAIYYFLCVKDIFREQITKNKNVTLEVVTNFLRTKFFATFGNSVENSGRVEKCEHRAINENKFLVRQYKVDGNIFVEGKKCDFLVLNDDKKDAYLIELKRSRIHEGIEQLESTYEKIKTTLPDYQFLFRLVHAGTNPHDVRHSKTIRWKEKHGKTLDGRPIANLRKTPYEENI